MTNNAVSGAVAAAVLVALGGILLLGNVGYLGGAFSTSSFLRTFWPTLLIVFGLWQFAADGFKLGWKSSTLVALGVAVLFFNLGWFRLNIRLILPLALLGFGAVIVLTIRHAYRLGGPSPDTRANPPSSQSRQSRASQPRHQDPSQDPTPD